MPSDSLVKRLLEAEEEGKKNIAMAKVTAKEIKERAIADAATDLHAYDKVGVYDFRSSELSLIFTSSL